MTVGQREQPDVYQYPVDDLWPRCARPGLGASASLGSPCGLNMLASLYAAADGSAHDLELQAGCRLTVDLTCARSVAPSDSYTPAYADQRIATHSAGIRW